MAVTADMPRASANTVGGPSRTSCCHAPVLVAITGTPIPRSLVTRPSTFIGRPGMLPREQPLAVLVRGRLHVRPAGEVRSHECRQWLGNIDPIRGEADAKGPVFRSRKAIERQLDDAVGRLAVQQDQAACDAAMQMDLVVEKQASQGLEALFLAELGMCTSLPRWHLERSRARRVLIAQ
jgi:hypothetical protein